MTEAIRQQECLNALKTFNNTVVTIRLYPPQAPQIANAIERGYKTVKQFIRQHGVFTFGLRGGEPELCGEMLDAQIVQSISNLIVFRHLDLLEKERLSLRSGLERKSFKKLLEVFSAKVDQIKEEGGGPAYIARLGLENLFPPLDEEPDPVEETERGAEYSGGAPLEVRRDLVDVLMGKEKRPLLVEELMQALAAPVAGAPIVVSALFGVLEGMVQKQFFVRSPVMEQILINCSRRVSDEGLPGLVDETVRLLLQRVEDPAASLLLSQNFESDVGALFCRSLERQVSIERFGAVIAELRQAENRLRSSATSESRQLEFVSETIERLIATPRGKQFLGQEKAQSIIKAGEKARRARRVEAGIKALLQGNEEILANEEINLHLPFVLQKLIGEGMERETRVILGKLAAYYLRGMPDVRERVIVPLASIAENLMNGGRADLLEDIQEPLLHWLKNSENGDAAFERVCTVLHWLMGHAWQNEDYRTGDAILSIFYQIRSGTMKRSQAVWTIVGRIQDKGVDRNLMKVLLAKALAEPTDEVVSRRLILQGPIATRFLVESLIRAEKSGDRLKIIDLLTYGEQFLTGILLEKLADPMPWYGKRNLLKLLGETAGQQHLEVVYPFLHHEDLRVQQEAFSSVYKMSGKKRKEALLKALEECGESLKPQVMRALIPMADADIAQGVGQVLEEYRYYSDENRDVLLVGACRVLSHCPYRIAEKTLQAFLGMRNERGARKIGTKVWEAAREALDQVYEAQQDEKQLKLKAAQLRKSLLKKGPRGKGAEGERRLITGLDEEKLIREQVEKGAIDLAKTLLLDLIKKVARLRRFSQAEQLRDYLPEIDSMALTEMIRAAEIIEEEKKTAVDKGFLAIWGELLDMFTTDEFSSFYHSLEHRQYSGDDLVMKKGAIQNSLIFLNTGKIKLFYRDKDREVLAGIMTGGQILGFPNFFEPSAWTISAAALGPVDASVFTMEKLTILGESYPGLESKLKDFSRRFQNAEDIFQKADNDRRNYPRHQTPAFRLAISILNENGDSKYSTKGELEDISQGGCSFTMRIARRENARMLLGRKVAITLPAEEANGTAQNFIGVIVAIKPLPGTEAEYTLHIVFGTMIAIEEMEQLMETL